MTAPGDHATCPHCRSTHVRRSRRASVADRLLSTAFIYPFRCGRCLTRFRIMRWGWRYPRRVAD
jgi:hypothetical protein